MQAAELLKSQIAEGLIKGACAIKGSTAGVEAVICCGEADYRRGTPMNMDSVFDIASVSKVFGVTPLLLHCRAKKLLDFEEPLEKYLTELSGTATGKITLRQLATHYSGLDNSKP
ncbi:MAG: serine hydrolase domain-containing protein, partial [Victivallaceae bacterium]